MNTQLHLSLQEKSPAIRAARWLLESGIQESGMDVRYRGGMYAWLDLKTAAYPFIYSEITGYAVNAYLFFYALTKDAKCLEAARLAADWLLAHRYSDSGLVRTRLNHPAFDQPYFENWTFTFDQWIIVYGLACLAEVTRESTYHEAARSMADFLLAQTVKPDGSFYPVYNVTRSRSEETNDKWSRESGSFHAKALMALAKLAALTQKSEYRGAADALCRWTMDRQQKDGRFITQQSDGSTHLHPHFYTLEGLLSYGLSEKKDAAISAARRGLEWALDLSGQNGQLYCFFSEGSFLPFILADNLTQALRVGAAMESHGLLEGRHAALEALHTRLLSFQLLAGREQGGFFYGQEENGQIHYHVNAWVTMFAAQALAVSEPMAAAHMPYDMSFFV